MRDDFAVFVLSHGRAEKSLTVDTLIKSGYNGKWYMIIDNEDNEIELYQKRFGKDHVIVFDKAKVGETFDIMDNFGGRQVVTFARNAVYDIANDLGLKYFFEADDDLSCFRQRYVDENGSLLTRYVRDMDSIVEAYLEYMDNTQIDVLAFGQTGDLIGGKNSKLYTDVYRRKAMQGFFVRVAHRMPYVGRFNDDVNSYVDNGKRGYLFLTYRDIIMDTAETQVQVGGISEMYKKYGTYVKTFYSVILDPSCVRISTMGDSLVNMHHRIHHVIDWSKAVPKIISGRYKK
jgi:hypothetical protein